jgi:hydrogenase nickel incorporation protein HypA/HybF
MHELSATEALFDLVMQHAQAARAVRVTGVYVVIGELSSLIDDSVQFYFDLISRGTVAEGAHLTVRRVPAVFRCERCCHEYAPGAEVLACPACGSLSVRLIAGDEFYLEALDIVPPGEPAGAETPTRLPEGELTL